MSSFPVIPSQWPRTFSVLGLGFGVLIFVDFERAISPSFGSLVSDAKVASTLGALALFFLAYVLGEIMMIFGATSTRSHPVQLKRYAVAKFISSENNEHWKQLFIEAERRFELLCGSAASVFLILIVGLGETALDQMWGTLLFYLLVGPLLIITLFALATDSYSALSNMMDALTGFEKSREKRD